MNYNERVKEIEKRYSFINHKFTDDELKKLAIDICNDKVFTSNHLRSNESIMSVFMPLMFIKKTYDDDRKGKIERVLFSDIEDKLFNENVNKILLVYEYYDKQMPLSCNGLPIFASMSIISNLDDYKKLNGYISNYQLKIKEIYNEI